MLIEGASPSIRTHGLNDFLLFQAHRLWMEYPSRGKDELDLTDKISFGKPSALCGFLGSKELRESWVRHTKALTPEPNRGFS
jgi:hypothetical protein